MFNEPLPTQNFAADCTSGGGADQPDPKRAEPSASVPDEFLSLTMKHDQ